MSAGAGRRLTGDASTLPPALLPVQRLRLASDLDREADAALGIGRSALAEQLSARAAEIRATCMAPEQLAVQDERRLRLGAEHLSALGTRALACLLLQVAHEQRDLQGMLDLLDQWRARLAPETVRVAGGSCFPHRVLHGVRP